MEEHRRTVYGGEGKQRACRAPQRTRRPESCQSWRIRWTEHVTKNPGNNPAKIVRQGGLTRSGVIRQGRSAGWKEAAALRCLHTKLCGTYNC